MDLFIEPKTRNRLIVLIPDSLADNTELARKIHHIADQECLSVLYLVLVNDADKMLDVSRSIATMKAVTSASSLIVESKLIEPGNLLQTLQMRTYPGDMIARLDEPTVASGYFQMVPASEFLASDGKAPVSLYSNGSQQSQDQSQSWFYPLLSLLGFFVIIVAFTWLEMSLNLSSQGGLQKLLLIILFVIELGALFAWNKWMSR